MSFNFSVKILNENLTISSGFKLPVVSTLKIKRSDLDEMFINYSES